MNESPIRILILEDSLEDAEMMQYEIRKSNLNFKSKVVNNGNDFKEALNYFKPNVILSDYNVPGFNGRQALNLVIEKYPDIPVIIVTGAFSDVEAAELISSGACDYILKDRLARLGPAVEKALSAARQIRISKNALQALRESEEKFRAIFEGSHDAIMLLTPEGFIDCNNQALDLFGLTEKKEFISTKPADFSPEYQPDGRLSSEAQFTEINLAFEKGQNSFEWLHMRKNGEIFPADVLLSPIQIQGEHILQATVRDITERRVAEEEKHGNAKKIENVLLQTIEAVAATVEARDPYTAGHQRRVAMLASAIAREMGYDNDVVQAIYLGGTIHDLGKIHLPAEILNKPGRLLPVEFELIKTHPQVGYDIIKEVQFPWPIGDVILQHHERIDGSGYPQGIKGDEILIEAKILAVADTVEAMSSHRPYRAGLGIQAALEQIALLRGIHYEPDAVDACISLFRDKGFRLEA